MSTYAKGYAAGAQRVARLKAEIERLKNLPPAPASLASTVEYLLRTAEALTTAAECLIEAKAEVPKEEADRHREGGK